MYRTPAKSRPASAKSTAKRARTLVRRKQRTSIPTQVYMGKQTLPKQLFNTLRYTAITDFTLTTGLGKRVFSANGMYDPDITGTGGQPMYFDQLIALYDHYTVLRSRIKCIPVHSAAVYIQYSIYKDDDTTTVSNALDASCRPEAKWDIVIPSLGVKQVVLYQDFNAAATFGPNPQAQDSLQGNATANPTEQSYYVVQAYSGSGTSSNGDLMVEIEYDVVWDEWVTAAAS